MSCKNEYEKIKSNIVDGAAASTDITLTGIAVGDKIIGIHNVSDLADVALTGLAITANKFQVTASTASKKLLVIWADVSAG